MRWSTKIQADSLATLECRMLNKGPFIVQAVKLLDDVLLRMQAHQEKKTPRLRALRSWEDLFTAELVVE